MGRFSPRGESHAGTGRTSRLLRRASTCAAARHLPSSGRTGRASRPFSPSWREHSSRTRERSSRLSRRRGSAGCRSGRLNTRSSHLARTSSSSPASSAYPSQGRERVGAVVFVTQNLEELERFADRVAVLLDGRIVFEGTLPQYEADPSADVFA